jgi:hypothetical protein
MWATEEHPEHEGITGVTFDSDGHRLVGTLYLARGEEPQPTALLLDEMDDPATDNETG